MIKMGSNHKEIPDKSQVNMQISYYFRVLCTMLRQTSHVKAALEELELH